MCACDAGRALLGRGQDWVGMTRMFEADGMVEGGSLDEATRHVVELLSPLGPISARRLFGTWGLYLEDRIFAIVHGGIIYFRTNGDTVSRYHDAGSQPFLYRRADGRSTVLQYHEVPAHVLEDGDIACAWAYEAASLEV
jgi:DNA transformation protein